MPSQANDRFAEFVVDQLRALGEVRVKRMFGGAGLYVGETMFAIVDDARLFFRVAPHGAGRYEERGAAPFEPWEGHVMKGYWEVPADVLEDPEEAATWARQALDDARALKAAAKSRKPASRGKVAKKRS
jgi:DNA transformation protein